MQKDDKEREGPMTETTPEDDLGPQFSSGPVDAHTVRDYQREIERLRATLEEILTSTSAPHIARIVRTALSVCEANRD